MTDTTVTLNDAEATVKLSGEFEMAATFTVEPTLERLVETHGLEAVTLDLSGVTFIDSVGIGVIMRLVHESEVRGITLRLVPGPRQVQRVFEVAGLTDALPFEGERPDGSPARP